MQTGDETPLDRQDRQAREFDALKRVGTLEIALVEFSKQVIRMQGQLDGMRDSVKPRLETVEKAVARVEGLLEGPAD